ncbi:RagB/SusD family nutrient uptake outer membrane protein [Chitinophagaceae bacterium LB-8]|uniref:RagB/SusD family nutrient uptake outer membrane protein n=1 Tax=Paraflavisolibacter caeni TaxID=2982496 RepID=A0A9X3BH24_9BACT|nr:RagB/SusD family nutrient uptake outer membrane protein [Paraflavisolibacter caeni]MCU7548827.1 RagB/SusD family nutrient uptake outer membrane protein [Paraflavisolibacter caeni]
MKKYILSLPVLFMLIVSCNKNILDKAPIDSLTDATAFKTNSNFLTYSWGLYDYMAGYGGSGSALPPYFTSQELNTDNYQVSAGGNSAYITGTKAIPTQAGGATSSMQVAGWNFSYIRKVNVMLDHIDASSMTQAEKDHWKSVGYFFRALRYYDMIAAFGDVPWIENALNINDSTVLYAPRTSRDSVAKNILNNLLWAEGHIKPTGDGINTINVHVVRALISRFGLFEGTWRKYQGLADANIYLQACVTASQKLAADFQTLLPSYDDVYNSEDLVGKPGIILCKQYVSGAMINGNTNTTHHTARFITTGNSGNIACPTNDMVESYLCADGKPISTSATYVGDSIYSSFRSRDTRLYFTVCPPYRVTMTSNPVYGWSQPWVTFDTTKTPTTRYNEYIRLMNGLAATTASKSKTLPLASWAPAPGNYIPQMPHFAGYVKSLNNLIYDNGANGVSGQAGNTLGYKDWKLYNRLVVDASNGSSNDCPIFRIEEVLLNYAEAAFELGQFNQTIADQTINRLRKRVNMPDMIVANISAAFDTKRDADVDPVLWEIRRERRVELMGDGFRFNDIKRWKKGAYMNKVVLGARVRVADYPSGVTFDATSGTTYKNVRSLFTAAPAWNDKYYLEPIPTQEMVINPKLIQTKDWQ